MINNKYLRKKRIRCIMVESKILIKVGMLEVNFEGSEEFIKNELLTMLGKVKDMFSIEQVSQIPPPTQIQPTYMPDTGAALKSNVKAMALKLNAKTGPDLVIAAAAHLTFVEGCEEFSRKQILANMKKAKGIYKNSFGSNLGQALNILVKNGKLNSTGTDSYTLPQEVREELKIQLA